MGFFFCLPGAPYFLLPVYPGREGRKEFQKRISVHRKSTSADNTHTQIPELIVPSRGKNLFVPCPIEVPSCPFLEDRNTHTHKHILSHLHGNSIIRERDVMVTRNLYVSTKRSEEEWSSLCCSFDSLYHKHTLMHSHSYHKSVTVRAQKRMDRFCHW